MHFLHLLVLPHLSQCGKSAKLHHCALAILESLQVSYTIAHLALDGEEVVGTMIILANWKRTMKLLRQYLTASCAA